jgi:two-component system CheB/CheR fusion protein
VLRETVPEQHMALLEALTRALCPPAMVLDENHDLVEVLGDVMPFCRLPEGRMTTSAHAFLRPGLQAEARALLVLARADGLAASSQPLQLEGLEGAVRLEARQMWVGERQLTVLTFQRQTLAGREPEGPSRARDAAFDREIERLEHELLASQDTLRRSLAELEQTNEELEASSEELLASSEELQSSNEELEASNEELQATNEELATLNQQLGSRSEELERLNVELENIQTSLSQGMVIVDRRLRITRFSPLAVRVFGLVETDIGQPLMDVPTTVPLPGLEQALKAVVDGGPRQSLQAGSEDVAYLTQVVPYLERDGRRQGAIVTLTDVSELVAVRQAAEAALNEFSTLTDALDEVVWKWDHRFSRLLYASKRIHALTGWTPAEVCDRPGLLQDAVAPDDRARVVAARDFLQGHWSVTYPITNRDGRQIWVKESGRVVRDGDERFVVGTLEVRASELSAIFESVFHSGSFGVAVLDDRLRVVMANAVFCGVVGFDPDSIVGVNAAMLCPLEELEALILEAQERGNGQLARPYPMLQLRNRDGMLQWVPVELRTPGQPSETGLITLIVHPPA